MNQSFSRTTWAGLLALTSLIAGSTRSCVSTAHADPLPLARAVGCIGLTVSDVDRSTAFYQRVLSFEKASEVEQAGDAVERLEGVFAARTRTVRMKLGAECLDLTEYLAPRGRPAPPDARSNDRWFQHVAIVVSDMDRAYSALRAARVEHASTGPQRLPDWNPKAAGIRAFYFRDPDHHVLEVLQFPAGKGEPRWQRKGALFLGIDHTAIVVGDTEASIAFYSGLLGLKVAGTSENWGSEQEHLNSVFGARLRITTLRGSAGPGVELLEYLAPRDGRPIPADERANDLIHWQTTVFVTDLDSAAHLLRGIPVSLPGAPLGYSQAFLVRDPDGHVLQFTAE
jgi:catechol 2,3-dioxygenase-like lactoylglutathione lyase family enzyme